MAVNLPDVEVIGKDVAVADFVNLTHDFSAVVAKVFNIYGGVFSGLGYIFLKSI